MFDEGPLVVCMVGHGRETTGCVVMSTVLPLLSWEMLCSEDEVFLITSFPLFLPSLPSSFSSFLHSYTPLFLPLSPPPPSISPSLLLSPLHSFPSSPSPPSPLHSFPSLSSSPSPPSLLLLPLPPLHPSLPSLPSSLLQVGSTTLTLKLPIHLKTPKTKPLTC